MEIKFKNVDYTYKKVNYEPKEVLKNINIEFMPNKVKADLPANAVTEQENIFIR